MQLFTIQGEENIRFKDCYYDSKGGQLVLLALSNRTSQPVSKPISIHTKASTSMSRLASYLPLAFISYFRTGVLEHASALLPRAGEVTPSMAGNFTFLIAWNNP
jgi:hypothetical protein